MACGRTPSMQHALYNTRYWGVQRCAATLGLRKVNRDNSREGEQGRLMHAHATCTCTMSNHENVRIYISDCVSKTFGGLDYDFCSLAPCRQKTTGLWGGARRGSAPRGRSSSAGGDFSTRPHSRQSEYTETALCEKSSPQRFLKRFRNSAIRYICKSAHS